MGAQLVECTASLLVPGLTAFRMLWMCTVFIHFIVSMPASGIAITSQASKAGGSSGSGSGGSRRQQFRKQSMHAIAFAHSRPAMQLSACSALLPLPLLHACSVHFPVVPGAQRALGARRWLAS